MKNLHRFLVLEEALKLCKGTLGLPELEQEAEHLRKKLSEATNSYLGHLKDAETRMAVLEFAHPGNPVCKNTKG